MEQNKPLLSIGMIFKNEIRCLERCMKSLQPLRDAIPCELVMADTGATDGSREVAERYADLLFDFEWIDDFAAARNAVMDRCRGEWYLSIDCDEWLDEDISELVTFLTCEARASFGQATVIIRNYKTPELERGGDYSNFITVRMVRMSLGMRYEGAIHEHWPAWPNKVATCMLNTPIFHHDGYLANDAKRAEEKNKRNMTLLRQMLSEDPENIKLLMQCVESDFTSVDTVDYVRRGVRSVKNKGAQWDKFGAPMLRYAVIIAHRHQLPELEEWIELAESTFPDSIYTKLDVNLIVFSHLWTKGDYEECLRRGQAYLKTSEDYEKGNFAHSDLLFSTLTLASPKWKMNLSIFMGGGYLYTGQTQKAVQALGSLDGAQMTPKHVSDYTRFLTHLRTRTGADTDKLLVDFWEQINRPVPSQERADQRRREFVLIGAGTFLESYRRAEEEREDFHRHAYTLFLPLEGQCELGDAARIMASEEPEEMERVLACVEDWDSLPPHALGHALAKGVRFPLPERPLYLEEVDILASKLARDGTIFAPILAQAREELRGSAELDIPRLTWLRGIALAAVHSFAWTDGDSEEGMARCRFFAQVEERFVALCYAPALLTPENIRALPPMHRFGWYCAAAFQALDKGDAVEYVRLLRKGLDAHKGMKHMVDFMVTHTEALKPHLIPEASAELLALAEQVKAVLAQYDPADPAVAALKQSEAYQKVAFLLEDRKEVVFS